MAITIYDIIQGAVLSEKAQKLNADKQQLVLNVHAAANKPLVKEALEKLFNVKVKQVRIAIRKGKRRSVKRTEVWGKDQKRAIITLAEGYSLDLLSRAEGRPAQGGQSQIVEQNQE